jgi:hypothetical protein
MSQEIKWSAPRGPGRSGRASKAGKARSRKGVAAAALGLLLAGAGIYWTMSPPEEDSPGVEEEAGLEALPEDGPVFPSLESIRRADSMAVFGRAPGRSSGSACPAGGCP